MTVVNPQITDSVTQPNIKVLGEAPAVAMGNLYQATAQALGNAAHNAAAAQQQIFITAQAATTQAIATMLSIDTAATARTVADTKSFVATPDVASSPDVTIPIRELAESRAGSAAEVAYGMHATMDAFSASLESIGAAVTSELLRVLQIAATSACLTAMIAEPEKASNYEEVLAAIKKIA